MNKFMLHLKVIKIKLQILSLKLQKLTIKTRQIQIACKKVRTASRVAKSIVKLKNIELENKIMNETDISEDSKVLINKYIERYRGK